MRVLTSTILLLLSITTIAQSQSEFQFDQARVMLAKREIVPAIELLKPILKSEPSNSNINFLLGAAYTELPGVQEEGLSHLLIAAKDVSESYQVGDYKEKSAPIHLYYYLLIAFAEKDECAEANEVLSYLENHSKLIDPYFIEEAKRHLQKCPFDTSQVVDLNELIRAEIKKHNIDDSKGTAGTLAKNDRLTLDSAALAERGMLVQKLKYTTNSPLYGVQIASHLNTVPIGRYNDFKNLDVFVGNEGYIRYVVGHFSYRSQAEKLLEKIQAKGYTDAFIVNVNDARKYSNELISYNNINLRTGIQGPIQFFIQIGAFKEKVTEEQIEVYFDLEGIQEIKYNDLTILAVGEFPKYAEAESKLQLIKESGYTEAFIVAFNKGKKIPLSEAKNFTE
ncbi:MAG: SPOR domain-containing protein [Vicingaceae bacterium]